jgi:hypothetical protein
MRKAKTEKLNIVFVSPDGDLPKQKARIAPDQKVFSHDYNLSLEFFAHSLFGEKYHKSVNCQSMTFWKKFYISTFEVLQASIFTSIGSVDPEHRRDIEQHLAHSLKWLRECESKDKIHAALIVSLFKLVFLLLGRLPYTATGKKRDLSTFRTLTYSQTDEQLSYLLESHMRRQRKDYGFDDKFDVDCAFRQWCKANRRSFNDRHAYVDWVRTEFPNAYEPFR